MLQWFSTRFVGGLGAGPKPGMTRVAPSCSLVVMDSGLQRLSRQTNVPGNLERKYRNAVKPELLNRILSSIKAKSLSGKRTLRGGPDLGFAFFSPKPCPPRSTDYLVR